jgi:creatinine amidohydrolase
LEFHAAHLPIGLDGLTAHGICLRAASKVGGVVLPPHYLATGGGHTRYPWSILMSSGLELRAQLATILERLQHFGIRVSIMFTGHFAPEQLAVVDEIAEAWNARGTTMQAVPLGINRCDASPVLPDHAGVFETSILHALWPDRVDISQLPARTSLMADEAAQDDPFGPQRHDPDHPLWGVFGPDPRNFDTQAAYGLLDSLVAWLADTTHDRLADRGR